MEGLFFVLIGAALFAHSWYLLEFFADDRAVGITMAALGAAIVLTLWLEPQLLGTQGTLTGRLAQISSMNMLVVLWGIYALAVAAHRIWDFEERAIGFFGVPLTAGSAVALAYFASVAQRHYETQVWLSISIGAFVLALLGATLFFYMAIPFHQLRIVAGWFFLVGSVIVTAVGLAIVSSAIALT